MTRDVDTRHAAGGRVLAAGMRWSRWVVLGTLVTTVVVALLPVQVSPTVVLVLAGLGLLAGLPHGSLDHLVAATLTGRSILVVTTVYAGGAVLTWLLLSLVGPVAIVAVLLLSAAHFGLGELELVRETTDWYLSRPVAVALAVSSTGALLLPLARAGDPLSGVATSISPGLGELIGAGPVRVSLAAVWAVGAVVTVIAALRARRYAAVLDVVLVGSLGALAPPLLAFAVWFGGWHGLRHCARLLTVDDRCAELIERGHPRQAVATLVRLAAWPTAAAALTLAGLLVFTATAADPTAALGRTLVVLLALTVPHMLVVWWLDTTAVTGRRSTSGGARLSVP